MQDVLTTARVPKILTPCVGSKSMMILNVSQMFASANQEKTRVKTLYCSPPSALPHQAKRGGYTYEGLDVEEEHADDAVA